MRLVGTAVMPLLDQGAHLLSRVESWLIPAACRVSFSILKAAIREAVMASLRMISLCSASEEHGVFSNRILSRGVMGEMLGLPDQRSQGSSSCPFAVIFIG